MVAERSGGADLDLELDCRESIPGVDLHLRRSPCRVWCLGVVGSRKPFPKGCTGVKAKSPAKSKGGRPTDYRKTFPDKAAKLWARGATDEEVAGKLGVSRETLYQWLRRYPEFADAQKTAKAVADQLVERALFQRATGFSHPDTHFSAYEGHVTATPFIKHYPPDPVSCIFWLKNRRPDLWRDRIDGRLELTTVAGLPNEVLVNLRKLAEAAAEKGK